MILPIESKEIPTILVNKKWIQRKKDTISAEYDERKVFSYLKRRRRRKKKNIKSNPPLSLLPPKPTHTQKKSKQDRRNASPVSSWAITKNAAQQLNMFIFFRFWFKLSKKKDFTLLFISLVGTTHVSSTAASKACKITMEAMAGRLEQTARPGCTSYSLRSENHQLPSNSDWVEKHLKKPPKHITAAAAEADHRVSSLVASAALRKSSL